MLFVKCTVFSRFVQFSHGFSINADTQELKVSANLINSGTDTIKVSFDVYDGGHRIAGSQVMPGTVATIQIPSAKTWSPNNPHLYDLIVTLSTI